MYMYINIYIYIYTYIYICIYCRTRNFRVCLYIAYLASGAASLYIKTL